MAGNRSLLKTFRDGLYTQLSNPKPRWCLPRFYRPAADADPHRVLLHRAADEFLIDVSWYSAWWRWCSPPIARVGSTCG